TARSNYRSERKAELDCLRERNLRPDQLDDLRESSAFSPGRPCRWAREHRLCSFDGRCLRTVASCGDCASTGARPPSSGGRPLFPTASIVFSFSADIFTLRRSCEGSNGAHLCAKTD